jgi:GTP-sensing pleiotropic transcriptional regulator CodY
MRVCVHHNIIAVAVAIANGSSSIISSSTAVLVDLLECFLEQQSFPKFVNLALLVIKENESNLSQNSYIKGSMYENSGKHPSKSIVKLLAFSQCP